MRRGAIVALIFGATTGVMLLKFPVPLLQGVANAASLSFRSSETLPVSADEEETLELRRCAKIAMNALKAKSSVRERNANTRDALAHERQTDQSGVIPI